MSDGLYPFQRAVDAAIAEGRNVILQAPTGSGKTIAALRPFLRQVKPDAERPPDQFPRRCIYSVPMRVLANQFVAEYRKEMELAGYKRDIPVSIQTGEQPDDPRFEAALIFATIDQTLSSFLHLPYGLSHGQANLNAGAVIGSYLVFDEFHLYSPDDMLPTTLAMLRLLRDTTPFILMTATFSQTMLEALADWLDAVVIPNPAAAEGDADSRQQMQALPTQHGKERVFHFHDQGLDAQAVLAHRGERTICICNTVDRAQALYRALRQRLDGEGIGLTLLHSRFLAADRAEKEESLRQVFGPARHAYDGPPHILVATQVVEVGLDITSDVLLTELAPAASLLQRAGRCARRKGERGAVHVYLPRDPETGEPDYAPYFLPNQKQKMARAKVLCNSTYSALAGGAFTGKHMDFALEQALIDEVHTPVDLDILEDIQAGENRWLDRMLGAMASGDYGQAPELIRDSGDTRYVFIHPDPGEDRHLARTPWHYEGFNLRPGTIFRHWKELLGDGDPDGEEVEVGDLAWRPIPVPEDQRDTEDSRHDPRYTWQALAEPGELYQGALALALSPEFACYDADLGLTFALRPGVSDAPSIERKRRPSSTPFAYQRETYTEHIAGLLRAYTQALPLYDERSRYRFQAAPLFTELAYVGRRLAACGRLQAGALDRMARVIIALHDVGKLNTEWQEWAHNWQQLLADAGLGEALPEGYFAAHTDFDSGNARQKKLQKRVRPRRPRHAGESTAASARLIGQAASGNEGLFLAALNAVMCHHTPGLNDFIPFSIQPAAAAELEQATALAGVGDIWGPAQLTRSQPSGNSLSGVRFDRQYATEVLLYSLLVRVLRLADQRSQAGNAGEAL